MWTIVRFGSGWALFLALAGGAGRAQMSAPHPSSALLARALPACALHLSACNLPAGRHGAQAGADSRPTGGVVIDRLVALVNEDPITESDLLWFLTLDAGIPTGPFPNDLKRRALEQYIDQQLLYQEAKKLPTIEVSQDEIEKYIAELTGRFQRPAAFHRRLDAVGLDRARLQKIVKRRLTILQFIEFRFRAFVFVSDEEVQSYYQRRVLPLAREKGESPPPLDQLKDLIEKNIIQEKVSSELIDWFEDARRRSDIVYLVRY